MSESAKHLFDMPVRAEVAKFLAARFKLAFVVTRRNKEGRLLLNLLHSPHIDARFEEQIRAYPMLLTCEVSRSLVSRHRTCNLSSRTIYDFNAGISDVIRDELYLFADIKRGDNPALNYPDIVQGFMDRYDFDENDMNAESLLRDLTRYRNGRKKRADQQNCSPIVRPKDGPARLFPGARIVRPLPLKLAA